MFLLCVLYRKLFKIKYLQNIKKHYTERLHVAMALNLSYNIQFASNCTDDFFLSSKQLFLMIQLFFSKIYFASGPETKAFGHYHLIASMRKHISFCFISERDFLFSHTRKQLILDSRDMDYRHVTSLQATLL